MNVSNQTPPLQISSHRGRGLVLVLHSQRLQLGLIATIKPALLQVKTFTINYTVLI